MFRKLLGFIFSVCGIIIVMPIILGKVDISEVLSEPPEMISNLLGVILLLFGFIFIFTKKKQKTK